MFQCSVWDGCSVCFSVQFGMNAVFFFVIQFGTDAVRVSVFSLGWMLSVFQSQFGTDARFVSVFSLGTMLCYFSPYNLERMLCAFQCSVWDGC